jgi:hypothetical protein
VNEPPNQHEEDEADPAEDLVPVVVEGVEQVADDVVQQEIEAAPDENGVLADDVASVISDESQRDRSRDQLGFADSQGSGYNLRARRHYGHKEGRWQEREREYGLHLTVRAALQKYKDKAEESMMKEVMNIDGKHVFDPVKVVTLSNRQRKRIIRSSMFLKEKYFSTGLFDKLKSRFVAGGNMQDRSIYGEWETTSPTVSLSSVYIAASIAALEGRKVRTMDIGGAYLNADMAREVLMRVEPKIAELFVRVNERYREGLDADGSLVVRLNKALYGCIESSKLWYDTLTSKLKELGFVANKKDSCVLNKVLHVSN